MDYQITTSRTQLLVLMAMLFVFVAAAFAQITTAGRMTGTVTDATGAVVPNVTVTAKNDQTQQTITVTTNNEGSWTMPSISNGTYTITVSGQGFKTTIITHSSGELP